VTSSRPCSVKLQQILKSWIVLVSGFWLYWISLKSVKSQHLKYVDLNSMWLCSNFFIPMDPFFGQNNRNASCVWSKITIVFILVLICSQLLVSSPDSHRRQSVWPAQRYSYSWMCLYLFPLKLKLHNWKVIITQYRL
jgi:hypothetical protein